MANWKNLRRTGPEDNRVHFVLGALHTSAALTTTLTRCIVD
jgi:hypothetical protein